MTFLDEVSIPVEVNEDDLNEATSLWRRQVEARCALRGDVDLDADVVIKLGVKTLRVNVEVVLNIEHRDDVVITILHSCIGRGELKDFGISVLLPSDLGDTQEFYVVIVQVANRMSTFVFVAEEDSAATILKIIGAITSREIV